MKATKSQRKKATAQHGDWAVKRRKWGTMTVTTLASDGTTTSVTKTASTGRTFETSQYTRRGRQTAKEITA